MKGRPPKPPGRRTGHRTHHVLPLRVEERAVPPIREGFLKQTCERWEAYWTSDISRAARDVHIPIVDRLFCLYDERERSHRAVQKEGRFVNGSKGQLVQHPLLRYIATCDGEIRQLEDRLGLSPRGAAQLGANLTNPQRSLEDLNRDAQAVAHAMKEIDPRELQKAFESPLLSFNRGATNGRPNGGPPKSA